MKRGGAPPAELRVQSVELRFGVSACADTFFIVRSRGGVCPARGFAAMIILRVGL